MAEIESPSIQGKFSRGFDAPTLWVCGGQALTRHLFMLTSAELFAVSIAPCCWVVLILIPETPPGRMVLCATWAPQNHLLLSHHARAWGDF